MLNSIAKIPATAYWRTLRKITPAIRRTELAGVKSNVHFKLFDSLLPARFEEIRDRPNYENALIRGLKICARPGDHITIIGGGNGVTAVIASKLVGSGGSVLVFEASATQFNICRSVIEINQTPNNVQLQNATVGKAVAVYHNEGEYSQKLPAEHLEECDILELDCEGSEIEILSKMKIRPREIIVETHGVHGAPTSSVMNILQEMGYTCSKLGVAEIDFRDYCIKNDIMVILAHKQSDPKISRQ